MDEGIESNAMSRAAIYRELHRDYLDQFNATRQIEWLINGALWAGIILAGGYLIDRITLIGSPWWIWPLAPSVAFVLHFLLWMYPIQFSENRSAALAEAYQALVHRELNGRLPTGEKPEKLVADNLPDHSDDVFFPAIERLLRRGGLPGMSWAVCESTTTAVLVLLVMTFLRVAPVAGNATGGPPNCSMQPAAGTQSSALIQTNTPAPAAADAAR